MVNQISDEDICPEEPAAAGDEGSQLLPSQPTLRRTTIATERPILLSDEFSPERQLATVNSIVELVGILVPASGAWSITAPCGHCGADT